MCAGDLARSVKVTVADGAWHHLVLTRAAGLPPILEFVRDPDPEVRAAVAFALTSYLDSPTAIAALELLSADPGSPVRDWATFGLAESPTNEDALRADLTARLEDPDDDVRAEAIYGLAAWHDPSVSEVIDREMERQSVGELVGRAQDLVHRSSKGIRRRDRDSESLLRGDSSRAHAWSISVGPSSAHSVMPR
jgi:hypothetical protein